jgi:NAD(P)-dependent dehydrogenase (short-subunit alcohol dehydrogenase family)
MFELSDRVVVVTGAGSGIGRAIALLFARRGARVAALDRDVVAAEATVHAIAAAGGVGHAVAVDVSLSEAVNRAFDEVVERWAGVDVLVNSAGIAHVGTLLNTPEADFDQLYQVNVKGVFLCARAALPHLLKSRAGSILNLASIASLIALKDRFAYSMTKGAVLTMTRSIALDYMGTVRCNCLCPARVHTPFVDQFVAKNYPGREQEMLAQLAAYQPIGRMGTPEEVAAFALYLCSDEASFVTGGAFPIDGGVLVG